MKTFKLLSLLLLASVALNAQVRITEVNTATQQVTLTNMGAAMEDVSNYYLCQFPAYDEIITLTASGPMNMAPAAAITIDWPALGAGADGECGLYLNNIFTSSASMLDYMEWGSGGHTREPVAVGAGVWCVGEFIAGASPYSFTGGATDYCSAFWSAAPPMTNVTFRVDMNNYVPAFGYVNVSGSYNGWCGDCNQLTDVDLDGVWEGTFAIPPGDYDFKYSMDNWAAQENLVAGAGAPCFIQNGDNTNRDLIVGASDIDLGVVCFESCYACPGAGTPGCMDPFAQNYNSLATEPDGSCIYLVTFQVNMNSYGGAFGATEVNSSFNGWCGNCNAMSDGDVDGIWDVQIAVQEGSYEYKFSLDAWADQEDLVGAGACTVTNFGNTNRYLSVMGDSVLPVVCWGSCDDCVAGAGCMDPAAANYDSTATIDDGSCEYLVTFSVDMNNFAGGFAAASVSGGFNGWCGNCNLLTDPDLDGVWDGTIQLLNGYYEFLFSVDGPPGQEVFSGGESCITGADPFWNRFIDVTGNISYGTVCYNSCDPCVVAVPGCMDPAASNYNSLATEDDGSCAYDVTFRVDMNNYVPAFGFVNVSASFNGWCGDCNQLTDGDLDGVWEGTFPVPPGNYEFKYSLDNWAADENLVPGAGAPCFIQNGDFTNRALVVGAAAMDLGVVCYESCYACPAGGTPGCMDTAAQNYNPLATEADGSCIYLATFQVNMNNYFAAFGAAEVNGSFNGWCGNCNAMADGDLDGIWDVTVALQEGSYEYKYSLDAWADQEDLVGAGACTVTNFGNTNRYLSLTGDVVLPVVCWGSCADCVPGEGCTDPTAANYDSTASLDDGSCQYAVTFILDMNQYGAAFTLPFVFGTWNGWCDSCNPLADPELDGVWEGTFVIPNGAHEFKFAVDNFADQEAFTGAEPCIVGADPFWNRSINVAGVMTYGDVCWDSCDACVAGVPGCMDPTAVNYNSLATEDDGSCAYNVTFRVDMNNYVPAFGYVNVSGSFNAWCGDCNQLTDGDLDGVWEGTWPVTTGNQEFKYSLDNWAASENLLIGGGAPCLIQNGDATNRTLMVGTAAMDLGVVCWESCYACPGAGVPGCMDTAAQNYNSLATEADGSCVYLATFQVNMNNYGAAFGATEVNASFNGWCGNCDAMTDADLDGIWDVTIALQEGSYEYKFSLDAWADQENLVGAGSCTVTNFGFTNRYLSLTGDVVLPVVCWASCADCVAGEGCTDPAAANYDSTATLDNGTCEYAVTFILDMNQYGAAFTLPFVFGTWNGWCDSCNPLEDPDLDGIWEGTFVILNGAQEFLFAVDNFADQEAFTGGEPCIVGFDPFWNRSINVGGVMTYGDVCWNSCDACAILSGCTDPTASNYDSLAELDDGSCVYAVTFVLDMNQYPGAFTLPFVFGTWNGWCDSCNPLSDPDLDGVWEGTFDIPNGAHEFKFAVDNFADQELFDATYPCIINADPFFNRGITVAGVMTYGVVCWNSCEACPLLPGCTYPAASNYDSAAGVDDGTCIFPGCTDPAFDNYNPYANSDDGSCADVCVGDLNGDGIINTTDLLIFLGVFGTLCN